MQYLEAVNNEKPEFKTIFLAGGIRGCRDWQKDLVAAIAQADLDITVFNPRRDEFPADDADSYDKQVTWEYDNLRSADIISFWFDKGTLCPTSLFEYGGALERSQILVVGCDHDYEKKRCIEAQTGLASGIEVNVGFGSFTKAVLEEIEIMVG